MHLGCPAIIVAIWTVAKSFVPATEPEQINGVIIQVSHTHNSYDNTRTETIQFRFRVWRNDFIFSFSRFVVAHCLHTDPWIEHRLDIQGANICVLGHKFSISDTHHVCMDTFLVSILYNNNSYI